MSVRDKTLDSKILDSARREFLEKGFSGASLRQISQKAGVTTGAIYKRYANKEALFEALVKPVFDHLEEYAQEAEERTHEHIRNHTMKESFEISDEMLTATVDLLYDNFDCYKLLLCCAKGSRYSNFLHDFVDQNSRQSYQLITMAYEQGEIKEIIPYDEFHALLTSYWVAIMETVIHDFSREKATHYLHSLGSFFNWTALFGL